MSRSGRTESGLPRALRAACVAVVAVSTTALALPGAQDAAERQLFDHAGELRAGGDRPGALAEYLLLAERFPSGALVGEALVRAAFLALETGDPTRAAALAGRVATEHARTGAAPGADVVTALVERSQVRDRAALTTLRDRLARVSLLYPPDAFPTTPWRAAADTLAAELSLELAEPTIAAGLAEAASRDSATDEWRQRARLAFARARLAEGDTATAARFLQETVDEVPDSPAGARARRMLGLIHRLAVRPAAEARPWTSGRLIRNVGAALDRPIGLATDADGTLMVADEDARLVAAIRPDGTPLWRQQPMNSLEHPWFDRRGVPYIQTGAGIVELAQRVRVTFEYPRDGRPRPVEKIRAGAWSLFGELLLVHEDGEAVSSFAPGGAFTGALRPSDRWEVVDLDLDASGQIYLLDRRAPAVLRYSPDGQSLGRAASRPWRRPESIAVDGLGNLYVLDRDERRIDVMDGGGRLIAQVGPGLPGGISLDEPRDLAVDDSGRLFIADRGLQAVVVLE